MNRSRTALLVAAGLAVLAALIALLPDRMISPGQLNTGHAALAADCFACHAPFAGASPVRCVACHEVAGIGLRTTKGIKLRAPTRKAAFHQDLTEQDCMTCHSDHAGPGRVFKQALVFDHALLLAALGTRCSSCHTAPLDGFHKAAGKDCATCHGETRWSPATFDHGRYFDLDEVHGTNCVTCHIGQDYSRYTCFGCHEHKTDRMKALHRTQDMRSISDCARCHRAGSRDETHGNREDAAAKRPGTWSSFSAPSGK